MRLPTSMRGIHPVFHVSQLEPITPNKIPNRIQAPPLLVIINEEVEFEVASILDSKFNKCFQTCPLQYYVKWASYEGTDEESSWVGASDLEHSSELVEDFHTKYPGHPGSFPQFQAAISS